MLYFLNAWGWPCEFPAIAESAGAEGRNPQSDVAFLIKVRIAAGRLAAEYDTRPKILLPTPRAVPHDMTDGPISLVYCAIYGGSDGMPWHLSDAPGTWTPQAAGDCPGGCGRPGRLPTRAHGGELQAVRQASKERLGT